MNWFKPFRRKPEPWTPGRVVALFAGWDLPPGVASLVSVATRPAGGKPELKVSLFRPATRESAMGGACLCSACLAENPWPAMAATLREDLAAALAPNPFEFKVSAPTPADVASN